MNDQHLPHISAIPDDHIRDVANQRLSQRALRRAAAINAVQLAREHAGLGSDPFSQTDADVIMAIMELLDRVAA